MRKLLAAMMVLAAAGCTERLPPPAADVDALVALRSAAMVPMGTGAFTAEGQAATNERGVSVRLGTFRPPEGQRWSNYLASTVAAQLQAAGRLDGAAPTVISAALTQNRAGENMADGKAVLSARFEVRRGGMLVYNRVQTVTADWDSAYWGFVAYEAAMRNYTALYPQLVRKLIDDPDFRGAVAP